jgi:hypothetical protein
MRQNDPDISEVTRRDIFDALSVQEAEALAESAPRISTPE